jgi:uncharacterized membrane protein
MSSMGAATGQKPTVLGNQPDQDESTVQKTDHAYKDPELAKWQRTLLPVMTLFVTALAVMFFVFSTNALRGVGTFVQGEHGELRDEIRQLINQSRAEKTPDEVIRQGLLILEADALDRRYHQASALLMSRIWAKHLAFMTGMIMAFLGAIFILGKLSESSSQVEGGSSQWKVSITSASPGIILAFFGTTLVALSIIVQGSVDVKDVPVYLRAVTTLSQTQGTPSTSSEKVNHEIIDALGISGTGDSHSKATPHKQ